MNTTHNPTEITAQPGTPFLDVVREFEAPPALVFRAHVDPELVVQWLGPRSRSMRIDEWDACSGGSYRYVHYTDGDDFDARFHGVFHSVKPDVLLVQTFEFEGMPDHVALDTTSFDDLGDGRTRIHIHSVFPSIEARDMAVASGMNVGITDSMERLDELLAR